MDKQRNPAMQLGETATLAILIPCALYLGAYGIVVERGTEGIELSPGRVKTVVVARYGKSWSSDVWKSEIVQRVFLPANANDRKLYPEKWKLKK